ncbi:class I SAM-dependent methyltransferase [Streptomyces sp. A7024]|uniref:Class I SAM-dependent methyltransferase n=1 Tax=Streptomyces coryli TaxID=1128680 RepID=A0A6G4U4X9_9ACTN|nr:class I SAM-dependent methyltransferase [Streptomyces coryli]NGN67295.1 class I SAM-dependent methyltransferase [Streptomyces coryli]
MTGTETISAGWEAWQTSWDRQQEWYMPDREDRFRVMLDMTEAFAGPAPRVLDLACGTGSISDRVLRRFPEARTTGVDLDPALLAIARGYFADEARAEFVSADLRDADWTAALPHREYDVVLTATALHWLETDALATLYGQLAGVVREGGVFLNADHMPDESTPRINERARAHAKARQAAESAAGVQDWAEWWRDVAADPVLGPYAAERFQIFGDPTRGESDHHDAVPSADWHARTLRAGGFAEARTVWASPRDAMVLALR